MAPHHTLESSRSSLSDNDDDNVKGVAVVHNGDAITPIAESPNATLTGVKKKMVTEWRKFDKILISVGIFFINFVTSLDGSATSTIQPQVLSDFNAMTRIGLIGTVTYLLIAGIRPIFAKISD
ncbi:hypothetical protein GGF41_005206, partial [Coemansia sp. RSA 2531]